MDNDRVWVLEDPDERPRGRKKPVGDHASRPQKNPAVAFTLSILVWGGGQIYNHQGNIATLLILLMVNFYVDPALIWMYRDPLFTLLRGFGITPSQMLVAMTLCYFSGLLVWLSSAEQAYHRTTARRIDTFRGVNSSWIPAACSLVLPGWGQFMNGQAEKGALFLLVALLGFFSVPTILVIWFFWPALETAADRLFWERILVAIICLTSMVVLLWPLNCFDALKVSLDETKKEPILKRLEYANNRRRMFGWGRGVFPFFKQTVVFALFLIFCSAIAYYSFPQAYYVTLLQRLQVQLSQQQMVLIPQLLDRLLHQV